MKLRLPFVDRIWRVRDTVEIDERLTPAQAFERLDPLFGAPATEVTARGETLTYSKSNPAAQDKLATFTSGTLWSEEREGRTVLSYEVDSTALLLCFLAPLLFLALGQIAIGLNMLEAPTERSERADAETDAKEKDDEDEVRELHWIDQMLGAPAPETKEEKEKREAEEKAEEEARSEGGEDGEDEKHSPTAAYVLAGLFAAIYAVGRVLEPYLLKRTFRRALTDPEHFRRLLAHGDTPTEVQRSASATDPSGGS